MYCHNCGKEIATDSKFCPECGAAQVTPSKKANPIALEAKNLNTIFKQEKEDNAFHCPKCKSHNIYIDKKGYSLTKGIVGGVLIGPIGLILGKHKSNNLRYKCLDCGHKWGK